MEELQKMPLQGFVPQFYPLQVHLSLENWSWKTSHPTLFHSIGLHHFFDQLVYLFGKVLSYLPGIRSCRFATDLSLGEEDITQVIILGSEAPDKLVIDYFLKVTQPATRKDLVKILLAYFLDQRELVFQLDQPYPIDHSTFTLFTNVLRWLYPPTSEPYKRTDRSIAFFSSRVLSSINTYLLLHLLMTRYNTPLGVLEALLTKLDCPMKRVANGCKMCRGFYLEWENVLPSQFATRPILSSGTLQPESVTRLTQARGVWRVWVRNQRGEEGLKVVTRLFQLLLDHCPVFKAQISQSYLVVTPAEWKRRKKVFDQHGEVGLVCQFMVHWVRKQANRPLPKYTVAIIGLLVFHLLGGGDRLELVKTVTDPLNAPRYDQFLYYLCLRDRVSLRISRNGPFTRWRVGLYFSLRLLHLSHSPAEVLDQFLSNPTPLLGRMRMWEMIPQKPEELLNLLPNLPDLSSVLIDPDNFPYW